MSFFIRFFLTMLILLIAYVALVFAQTGRPTLSSQWVYDAYEKKTAVARGIEEPKIVIVSGSNALFGINSEMIERHFGKKTLNYAVNAGVLLPYTLYKAKEVIKPHDTVILPLEYHMYTYDGVPNEQMIDYVFSRDPDAFFALTLKEQIYMVWNITAKRLYEGFAAKGGTPVAHGLYGAHNIDTRGDQIGATEAAKSDALAAELAAHEPNDYGAHYSKELLMWDYLGEFVSWCEARGAGVVLVPPAMLYFDVYRTDPLERRFYESIADDIRARGWEFVGDPYDYMYTKESHFNTDFHLTHESRDIHTQKLIDILKLRL